MNNSVLTHRSARRLLMNTGLALLALIAPVMVGYDLVFEPADGNVNRLSMLAVVCVFWAFSAALLLRKGQQSIVRLLFTHSQVLAIAMIYPLGHTSPWDYPPGLLKLSNVGFYFLAPLTLHLHMSFPFLHRGEGSSSHWRTALLVGIYLAAVAGVLAWSSGIPLIKRTGEIYTISVFTAATALLIYAYFYRASADSHRRLRLIFLGTLLGILPTNVFYFVPGLYGWPAPLPVWAVGGLLVLIPICYVYAITRQNLFGIDRWLNRSLVYFLLTGGIILVYLGPLIYLYQVLPGYWLIQALVFAGLTLLIGWNFVWLRTRVERLVDRLFYRGWYDYPGVIETVSNALARSLQRAQVCEVLTGTVPKLMYLHEGRLLFGITGEPAVENLPNCRLAEPNPAEPCLSFSFSLPDGSKASWLVAGRTDGEDFSSEDRRILQTLAQQAEIALNNVSLVEALHRQLDEIRSSREMLAGMQRQMLRSREDERSRLARDLHDGPLQTLAGLNIQLGMLLAMQRQAPASAPGQETVRNEAVLQEDLASMRVEVRGLLSELRQVCAELRPPMLDMLGLGAAIQGLVQEWAPQHGIAVELNLPGSADLRSLPDEAAVNLYRLTQEALTNVARHAQANNVVVTLTAEPDCTSLVIQDNGCGFDVGTALNRRSEGGHYGLTGMQERVHLIGGEWSVESAPGAGTTIRVVWPKTG